MEWIHGTPLAEECLTAAADVCKRKSTAYGALFVAAQRYHHSLLLSSQAEADFSNALALFKQANASAGDAVQTACPETSEGTSPVNSIVEILGKQLKHLGEEKNKLAQSVQESLVMPLAQFTSEGPLANASRTWGRYQESWSNHMNALNKYISAKPPSGPSASPAMYGPGRNAPRALSAKEERVAREKEKEREKDQELEQEVERTRSQLDSDRLVLVQNLHEALGKATFTADHHLYHTATSLQNYHKTSALESDTRAQQVEKSIKSVHEALHSHTWTIDELRAPQQQPEKAVEENDGISQRSTNATVSPFDFIGLKSLEQKCTESAGIKSGYLFIRSSSGFLGAQWHRRYFTLTEDGYFVSEAPSVASTPLGSKGHSFKSGDKASEAIKVHMLTSTIKDTGERGDGRFGFQLVSPLSGSFHLQAENMQLKQEWVQALQDAVLNALSDSLSTSGRPNRTRKESDESSLESSTRSFALSPSPASSRENLSMASVGKTQSGQLSFANSRSSRNDVLLELMMENQANGQCAECGAKAAEWASINLAVVLCIQCSGIHRNLGVHVSKVRSMTLDTESWTDSLKQVFNKVGNSFANSVWEATYEGSTAKNDLDGNEKDMTHARERSEGAVSLQESKDMQEDLEDFIKIDAPEGEAASGPVDITVQNTPADVLAEGEPQRSTDTDDHGLYVERQASQTSEHTTEAEILTTAFTSGIPDSPAAQNLLKRVKSFTEMENPSLAGIASSIGVDVEQGRDPKSRMAKEIFQKLEATPSYQDVISGVQVTMEIVAARVADIEELFSIADPVERMKQPMFVRALRNLGAVSETEGCGSPDPGDTSKMPDTRTQRELVAQQMLQELTPVLASVLESALKMVCELMPQVAIPNVHGTYDSKVGSVCYHVSKLRFDQFDFQAKNVSMEIDEPKSPARSQKSIPRQPNLSSVTVDKVCAATDQFEWRYARFSWPHLPGKGTAVVRVSNLRASIGYQLEKMGVAEDTGSGASFGGLGHVQISIREVEVEIDNVEVEMSPFEKAKRARTKKVLYDILTSMLKNQLREMLELRLAQLMLVGIEQLAIQVAKHSGQKLTVALSRELRDHIQAGTSAGDNNSVSTECDFYCYHHKLFAPPEPVVKPSPTDDLSVKERFIRAKYIQRAFIQSREWVSSDEDGLDEVQLMEAAQAAAVSALEQAVVDGDVRKAYEYLVQWPGFVEDASRKFGESDVDLQAGGARKGEIPKGQISVGTALHIACEKDDTAMLEMLLLNGAYPNEQRSSDGRTALHVASFGCKWSCVAILLRKDADASIRDTVSSSSARDYILRQTHTVPPPEEIGRLLGLQDSSS